MTYDLVNNLEKAKSYFKKNEYMKADELLCRVFEIDYTSAGAWRLYVEIEISQKRWSNARVRVKEALQVNSDEPYLYILQAKIEKNTGNEDFAVQCLNRVLEKWPNHRGIQAEILSIWQSQGEKLAAFPLLRSLRKQLTELPVPLLMSAARFFLSHKRFQVATELVQLSLHKQPDHENALALLKSIPVKAAQEALNRQSLEYAEKKLLDAFSLEHPLDVTWYLSAQIAYERKDFETAMERLVVAQRLEKDTPVIRHLQVKILRALGDDFEAAAVLNSSFHHWPYHPALQCAQLDLLRESGRAQEAFKILRDIHNRENTHPSALLAAARFYASFNRFKASIRILERVLILRPDNLGARLLYWTVLAKKSESEFITKTKSIWCRYSMLTNFHSLDIRELHHIVNLSSEIHACHSDEYKQVYASIIDCLIDNHRFLTEKESFELLEYVDSQGDAFTTQKIVQYLFGAGPKTAEGAKRLFSKTIDTVPDDEVGVFVDRILRFVPDEDRHDCMASIMLRLQGPKAGLSEIRKVKKKTRTLKQAMQLLDYMRLADLHRLTLRYIRFCRRRWKNSQDLALLHTKILLDAGYPADALEILDDVNGRHKRIAVTNLRARCLLQLGFIERAKVELESSVIVKTNFLLMTRLHTFLMTGQEARARDLIERVYQQDNTDKVVSGHFSVSLLGSLVNDLSLYRQEKNFTEKTSQNDKLVLRYTYPATQKVLSHVMDYRELSYERSCIPRNIVQYWNTVKIPASIGNVMSSWKSIPDTDYHRFSKAQARHFIGKFFGKSYEKAFMLASSPAEEADFFRLCYLTKFGGIYVDSDDGYYQDFNELFPAGAELICFREEYGALANNVIIASPGHPAIKHAMQIAAQSLLDKDNENTWHKTGPGLLSRTVAYFLNTATSKEVSKVFILPQFYLRRRVHIHMEMPHKKTNSYWNAKHKESWSYKCLGDL
ncbi:tetratricopeptide repeat protein [Cobetia sp. MC34]|uniref:tetratricopeptide repeat protein n=1 Tax=Cobetia sp. MC34 TaxID=2785080 RepID=UPI001BC96434|nr:tetratricopeptide repeat protein [Cobetia sp. MC34]MBS4155483.1 hypothetical protein [Cobetia sp. MC34]